MMRLMQAVPRELQARVDRELAPGERIEWIGMPVPRFFTPRTTGIFLFAIPWTAFAVFWICGAAEFKLPTFSDLFPLFGVPFVLIGMAMLSAPLWAYRHALRTVYVLTDRRAITFEGGWSTTIRSYPPQKLQDVYRKERRSGTGDVIMGRKAWRNSDGDTQSEELGFINIRNPKEVEDKVKALACQAARTV